MAAEIPSQRKLAQLVADHVFGDEHLQVRLAAVNHKCVAHEFGNDRAGTSPRGDRFLASRVILLVYLRVELRIDIRTFF